MVLQGFRLKKLNLYQYFRCVIYNSRAFYCKNQWGALFLLGLSVVNTSVIYEGGIYDGKCIEYLYVLDCFTGKTEIIIEKSKYLLDILNSGER
jgi:hypothetical protein